MSKEKTYNVSEIFGPTIQGEGVVIGRPTLFLRMFGCDSRCKMCDSMHAVDPKFPGAKFTAMTEEAIIAKINQLDDYGTTPVTISGGNPGIWELGEVVDKLGDDGRDVWVETQGTMWKDWFLDCDILTVSPKGPGMEDTRNGLLSLESLATFVAKFDDCDCGDFTRLNFKIVIFDKKDLAYAKEIHRKFPYVSMYLSVGNSYPPNPELCVPKDLCIDLLRTYLLDRFEWLCNEIAFDSFWQCSDVSVLPQLHCLLWGNKQGV